MKQSSRILKNGFFVILNEVKDLKLINMTIFFAALRMTNRRNRQFFNSLIESILIVPFVISLSIMFIPLKLNSISASHR